MGRIVYENDSEAFLHEKLNRIVNLLETIAERLAPAKKKETPVDESSAASLAWKAYSESFECRHKVHPVRNARTNSICKQLVARLGVEAIDVARFFPLHPDAFYFRARHDLALLLRDAEKIRTDWKTRPVTASDARGEERIASARNQLDRINKGEL